MNKIRKRRHTNKTRKRMSDSAKNRWKNPSILSGLSKFKMKNRIYHDTTICNKLIPQIVRLPESQIRNGHQFQYEPLNETMVDDFQLEFETEDSVVELKRQLSKILTERELIVITRLFGLDGEEPSTYEDIAELFDVTTMCIRLMRDRALKKLKSSLNMDELV